MRARTCVPLSAVTLRLSSASSSAGRQVLKLWSFDGAKHLVDGMGHSGSINSIIFSPDDRQMISVGEDGCIFVWNVYA